MPQRFDNANDSKNGDGNAGNQSAPQNGGIRFGQMEFCRQPPHNAFEIKTEPAGKNNCRIKKEQ